MNTIFSNSRWLKCGCAALLVGALTSGDGASAASFSATATINPGTACTADVTPAALAYGDINAGELSKERPTALGTQSITLTVACAPLASKFFFKIIDRNSDDLDEDLGAVVGVPAIPSGGAPILGWGLGTTAGKRPIGALFLKSTDIKADAQDKIILQSWSHHSNGEGNVTEWEKRPTYFFSSYLGQDRRYAIADPVSRTITAARQFTVRMDATPVISAKAVDGLSADASIDGRFTIEITQL